MAKGRRQKQRWWLGLLIGPWGERERKVEEWNERESVGGEEQIHPGEEMTVSFSDLNGEILSCAS